MSVIENWYNMSPQERKEHYELRKSQINDLVETLKRNKEQYKEEQIEKEDRKEEKKKEEKKKKQRYSFNCDIVLRKDFRISPKSKKYFSGDKDTFLDQQGEPVKESFEKDSLIIPNRVLYQKKKVVMVDGKYNLPQSQFMLQQIEEALRNRHKSQPQQTHSQNEYQNNYYQSQLQSQQRNESFLPQIHQNYSPQYQIQKQGQKDNQYSRNNLSLGKQPDQQFKSIQNRKQNLPQQRDINTYNDQNSYHQRNYNHNQYQGNAYQNQGYYDGYNNGQNNQQRYYQPQTNKHQSIQYPSQQQYQSYQNQNANQYILRNNYSAPSYQPYDGYQDY